MSDNYLNFYNKKIILASKSPRRKDILNMIDLDFQVSPSSYREDAKKTKNPEKLAIYHALKKAQDVAQNFANAWIIGADTIVVLKNEILEKPNNKNEAMEMLSKLSN